MARFTMNAATGCVTKEQTLILTINDSVSTARLLSNETYRIISDVDTMVDFTASGTFPSAGELNGSSGVYLPKDVVEYFTTTSDRVFLQAEQATASGSMYISRILGRGV